MTLKDFEYTWLVKAAFKKKFLSNELEPLLSQSTPGNVRQECANVYQERFDKKDEPTLRAFFGPGEQGRRFLAIIEDFNVDRFRPLNDYIKSGGEKGINNKNLELLAWLIDFPHRPFVREKKVSLSEEELSWLKDAGNDPVVKDFPEEKGDGPGIMEEENDIKGEYTEEQFVEPFKTRVTETLKTRKWPTVQKKSVLIGLTLLLFTCGSYTIWKWIDQQHGCMYWTGDQYVPIDCNEETQGRLFLPLDVKKMKNFQRVTKEDTITEWSIGKLYYIKDKKKIDYYTYNGNYPEDLNRYVKRLTKYIFDKDKENRK